MGQRRRGEQVDMSAVSSLKFSVQCDTVLKIFINNLQKGGREGGKEVKRAFILANSMYVHSIDLPAVSQGCLAEGWFCY